MEQKTTVLHKLQEAKSLIRSNKLKKDGENTYSNYKYFTPEVVEKLVLDACDEVGIICICQLLADEFGLYQRMDVISLDNTEDKITFKLRTKHGAMKATNEAQQMGGTDTYSERYIKMKVFSIKDNSMDPDSQDNRPKKVAEKKYKQSAVELKFAITPKQLEDLNTLALEKGLNEETIEKSLASAKNLKDYIDKKDYLETLPNKN